MPAAAARLCPPLILSDSLLSSDLRHPLHQGKSQTSGRAIHVFSIALGPAGRYQPAGLPCFRTTASACDTLSRSLRLPISAQEPLLPPDEPLLDQLMIRNGAQRQQQKKSSRNRSPSRAALPLGAPPPPYSNPVSTPTRLRPAPLLLLEADGPSSSTLSCSRWPSRTSLRFATNSPS